MKGSETHNQIAIELCSKVEFQGSESDTLSGSKESKDGKGTMQNKIEKSNTDGIKKAKEIKDLKSQISILENTIKDLQRNDKILDEKLSISLAEQQREREINNYFLRTCTCKSSSKSSKFLPKKVLSWEPTTEAITEKNTTDVKADTEPGGNKVPDSSSDMERKKEDCREGDSSLDTEIPPSADIESKREENPSDNGVTISTAISTEEGPYKIINGKYKSGNKRPSKRGN